LLSARAKNAHEHELSTPGSLKHCYHWAKNWVGDVA
jgi:hypothetical protein